MIKKCLFPAAGYGTRFLPATKAMPKEMLPVVNKPLIQYGVEEALDAGLNEISIVTGRGKRALEDISTSATSWKTNQGHRPGKISGPYPQLL
ncbi:UTP--glucose-1-phosphate uridylyltransferase, partial [Enterocytozoon bieneusi H348]